MISKCFGMDPAADTFREFANFCQIADILRPKEKLRIEGCRCSRETHGAKVQPTADVYWHILEDLYG